MRRTRARPLMLVACLPALMGADILGDLGIVDGNESNIAEYARTKLVGTPADELRACLGAPDETGKVGDRDVWRYVSGPHTYSAVPLRRKHQDDRYCIASFIFAEGVVESVGYAGRSGGVLDPYAECYEIVKGCMDLLSD